MTAISQAQGALVTAVGKTEGRGGERRANTAPLTRGTAICLVTIQEGNTEKMMGDLHEQLQHLRHQWPSTGQHTPRLTTQQCVRYHTWPSA